VRLFGVKGKTKICYVNDVYLPNNSNVKSFDIAIVWHLHIVRIIRMFLFSTTTSTPQVRHGGFKKQPTKNG
jgi:hypothetical protein